MLRNGGTGHLKELQAAGEGLSSVRLFSLRHEFPTPWAAAEAAAAVDGVRPLKITLTEQHYPFWSQSVADKQVLAEADRAGRREGGEAGRVKPHGGWAVLRGDEDSEPDGRSEARVRGGLGRGVGADGANDAWLAVQWGAPG